MKGKRVLVIGDLHAPFDLDGYLEFVKGLKKKYNTNETVFIGDVIDNHYSSYHETDPDGLSGGAELEAAIKRIQRWHKAFPKATVIIGNHDRMIMRKAFSSSIPKIWIKDYNDVLGTKGWSWEDRIVIDGVQYIHGEGGTARTRCKADLMSTVQGHLHTQAYTEWVVGANNIGFRHAGGNRYRLRPVRIWICKERKEACCRRWNRIKWKYSYKRINGFIMELYTFLFTGAMFTAVVGLHLGMVVEWTLQLVDSFSRCLRKRKVLVWETISLLMKRKKLWLNA